MTTEITTDKTGAPTTVTEEPGRFVISVDGRAGEVHRIVTLAETLACMTDGRLVAASPEIIVVLDAVSREVLEVTDLTMSRTVVVIELPWQALSRRKTGRIP